MTDVVDGLVSTIIPVRNRVAMLQEAVASVLAQTWRPIEVIISDDGSTDETVEVGRRLAEEQPGVVFYTWHENAGAGAAREHGRRLARGEFIQYLDSDDLLWPRKFEVQVAALRARPECGAAYGQIRLCPEDGPPAQTPHKWSGRKMDELFPALLVDRWWNTDAPLWRRSTCDAIGAWSTLRYSQDWDYDARAGALGVKLAYTPEFVCDQRHHAELRQTGSGRWLAPQDRVEFFTRLFDCARRAGVVYAAPEMRHFSRWVFFHARDCALAGDGEAARGLCELAAAAGRGADLGIRAFSIAGRTLGWRSAARCFALARGSLGRTAGRKDSLKQSWME
jgi:glycosyltransferase involved in cell wall biosynthesis